MDTIRIVPFNGFGQPTVDGVTDGDVLILVQGTEISIVRLELLPPERFGPCLDHAINEADLAEDARRAVMAQHPALFDSEQHWTLECPQEIAARARFDSQP